MSSNKIDQKRRSLLMTLGALKFLPAANALSLLGTTNLHAATGKKYFITIRTIFDMRDAAKTNYNQDLSPLAPFQNKLAVATGLGSNGDGSEYHNGKQKRFATACTPGNKDNTTRGGGSFNGKSFDLVVGEHLKNLYGTKESLLVLGAFPYSDLRTTFESFSFLNQNQYIAPTYNFNNINTAILNSANRCDANRTKYDVEALRKENMLMEALLQDYESVQRNKSQNLKEQLQNIQNKYDELKKNNQKVIDNGGFIEGDCFDYQQNPVAYNYTRGSTVNANYERQLLAMNHTAANALASNYCRSVSLNYNFSGHAQGNVSAYHEFTHPGGFSRPPSNNELLSLDELSSFQINMFAQLLRELEKAGILNDTVVIYSPHERPTHNHTDVPVLAYGANNAGNYSLAGRGLFVHDVGRDILKAFGVGKDDDFGGEKSKGGVFS